MKTSRVFAVFLTLSLLACAAQAERAWISTGKGDLNMRKKASRKADIVREIPDRSQVELLGNDGEWSYIEYKGKKGYVKTEFLSMEAPQEEWESAGRMTPSGEPAPAADEATLQQGGHAFVNTGSGRLNMRSKKDAKSSVAAEIPNGERVAVESAFGDWSRITYKGKTGYVKTQYLILDVQMTGRTVYSDQGHLYLLEEENDGAKSVVSVHESQPMTIVRMGTDYALVSTQASVYGEVQGYVKLGQIAQFRETPAAGTRAQMNAHMTLSSDHIALGGVLDVTVLCDGDAQLLVSLTRNGEICFAEKTAAYSTFSYRPRQAGNYRMELTALTPDGNTICARAHFSVEDAPQAAQEATVYSQKDGGWLDVKYGRSNMDQSGCAIFALSHGLHLLGITGEEASPQALAQTFPMYLTESGTVTSGLINAAGRTFNLATGKDKTHNLGKIKDYFAQGAVFTFSVASGHIALAAAIDEQAEKVLIVDSAPSATFARIENAQIFVRNDQGGYRAVQTLWDVPGARYYVETNEFGGLEYYLDLAYAGKRGLRMIRRK